MSGKLSVRGLFDTDCGGAIDYLGGYTSVARLKRLDGYTDAKNHGNISAADSIVRNCADSVDLRRIKREYADSLLLPVFSTKNVLPLALCIHVGLPICSSVRCVNAGQRKNLSALGRLLNSPEYRGEVLPERSYILVDDVVTQGGTIASLMRFVTQSGGMLSAVLSLAYARGGKRITPTGENIERLELRYGSELAELFKAYGVGEDALSQLTNSQITYLLRFSNIRGIKKKLDRLKSDISPDA